MYFSFFGNSLCPAIGVYIFCIVIFLMVMLKLKKTGLLLIFVSLLVALFSIVIPRYSYEPNCGDVPNPVTMKICDNREYQIIKKGYPEAIFISYEEGYSGYHGQTKARSETNYHSIAINTLFY